MPTLSLRAVLERAPAERRGECARVLTTACIAPTHSGDDLPRGLLRSFVYDPRGSMGKGGAQLCCIPEAASTLTDVLEAALLSAAEAEAASERELPAFDFRRDKHPVAHQAPVASQGIWFINSDGFDSEASFREFLDCNSRADTELGEVRCRNRRVACAPSARPVYNGSSHLAPPASVPS